MRIEYLSTCLLCSLLAGCSGYAGNWTGKLDSYTATFKIKSDSTGFFCYSKGNLTKVEDVVFNDHVIVGKKGSVPVSTIHKARAGVVEKDNFVVEADKFYRDDDLKMASAYCRKIFR